MAKLNNITIPDSIANRGRYVWQRPEIIGINGQHTAVTAPYARVVWQWSHMTLADYTWWRTTLLAGAASLTCSANSQLVDDLQVLKSITCVVLQPSYERIQNGLYMDVEVRIERIVVL